ALTLTTDYTLTGAGDEDGGSLTLVSSLSSDYRLTIINDPVDSQEADYTRNDPFPAETHEATLDRRTMVSLRPEDLINRSLKFSDVVRLKGIDVELPEPDEGGYLRVNNGGDGFKFVVADPTDDSSTFCHSGTGAVERTRNDKAADNVSV